MKFLSDILAKAGLTVDGVVTFNNTATGQTPATNDNSTKLATTAFIKNQSYLSANQMITVSGDATGSGTTSIILTLANSGVTAGVYGNASNIPTITVDAKGRITSISTNAVSIVTTLAGLSDVTLTSPSANQVLQYNGTQWVNGAAPVTYTLPIATSSILGGIKVGTGLSIDAATGILTVSGGSGGSFNFRTIQEFTSTAGQTTYTISGGYNVGYVEVLVNGVYISENQYTATNGSTIVLTDANSAGDIVTVFLYSIYNFGGNIYARNVDTLTATAGQTSFTTSYIPGQIDVYYNGSKLTAAEYTATSGTAIVLGQAAVSGDIVEVVTYLAGAGINASRTLTINGTTYDLTANRTWTLTTANISEVTNLYYTDARARAAISVTGSGSYNSSTGVITVTGGVTSVNTLTGAVVLTTTNIAEGTNLYYTDARVGTYLTTNSYATQTYVGTQIANLVASAPATLDTLNELASALGNDPSFATTVATSIGTKVPQTRTITINGTAYDLSADRSWTIASGVTSFNTRTGAITAASGDYTTAQVTESGNLYYTDTRVRAAISLTTTGTSGAATYDSATGIFNIPQYQGGVTSFNTRTGAITLSSSDVTTALTYTPVTNARTLTINGTTYDLTADRSWSIAAGVTSFNTRTGAISLTSLDVTDALTYIPVTNARTLTINGTSYDLSANRSWTIAPDVSVRNTYAFTATAAQTTFTVSGGYTVGLVDVFINGVKLAAADFTATNGTTVVLGTGTGVGNIVEIVKYVSAFTTAVETTRTLTINGTTYDLSANRTWSIDNASLGAQPQLNGTGLVRMAGTTVSYDNATYATQSYVTTAVANLVNSAPSTLDTLNELATALGNDANFATTVTTSIGTKQPQLNGTGFVKISGTTISYDNSTYLTTASASSIYQTIITNPVTGTGTTNYLPKFTSASTIGNSNITDTGSLITLGSNTQISSGALGIANSSLTGYTIRLSKNITGSTSSFVVRNDGVVQLDVTSDAIGFRNESNTAAAAFTLTNYWHFWARQGSIGAGSSITNQYGYVVDSNMIGATNNYGFQGSIPSGTNRWNLYMSGTAANYMAGVLNIGTTTLAGYALDVNGTGRFSGDLRITNNNWLVYTDSTATARNILTLASNDNLYLQYKAGSNFYLRDTDGNLRLTIASTGAATFSASVTALESIYSTNKASGFSAFSVFQNGSKLTIAGGSGGIQFNNTANSSGLISIFDNGNVLIGTTGTDGGYKLDVNGTGRFTNTLTVIATSSGRYFNFINDSSASYLDVSHSLNVRVNGASSLITALTIASSAAATFSSSVTAGGAVIANSSFGFRNNTYVGGLNPIWCFNNAPAYGMGYYQVNTDILGIGMDAIGFFFSNTSTPQFFIKANGGAYFENSVGIGTKIPRTRLQVTPTSNAETPVLGTATGAVTFTSANTNYGIQFNSTSDGSYFIQSQRFDASATAYALGLNPVGGYVYLGKGWGASNHRINLEVAQGNNILVVSAYSGASNDSVLIKAASGANPNATTSVIEVTTNSSTGRSISAGGTINASGNDYAEYMLKAVTDTISKGDIVGIDNEGLLTNIFSDSVSFVVKSTNPSYVGGDAWGNIVGKRPERTTNQTEEYFAPILAEFEAKLEVERQKVDRIAFSGQVPCNVYDASVGDYIIPIETLDGKITGQAVTNPTFEQYQISVGKVWKIMEDGCAWIAVKIG